MVAGSPGQSSEEGSLRIGGGPREKPYRLYLEGKDLLEASSQAGAEERFLQFLLEQTGALAVFLFRQNPAKSAGGLEKVMELAGAGQPSDRALPVAARTTCAQALKQERAQIAQLARPGGAVSVLCTPIPAKPGQELHGGAISLILKAGEASSVELALALVQWVASEIALNGQRTEEAALLKRAGEALQSATALSELVSRASAAVDLPQAYHTLVSELGDAVGCDRVLLATWRWRRCRVVAISGTNDASKRSESHELAEVVLRTAIEQKRELSSFAASPGDAPVSFLPELQSRFGARMFLAAPLVCEDGNIQGAWLFLWNGDQAPQESRLRLVRAANAHIAAHLPVLVKSKPGAFGGSVARLWKKATINQRRAVVSGVGLIAGVLLMPIANWIKMPCQVEPVVRRVVAAPFESLLRKAWVHAGQEVAANQLLAEMDGREIRWQLSETIAKQARCLKQAEKATTDGDIAAANMAQLEAEGLAEERKLLEYRRDNLEVRAPIAGVVISGDLERTEGVPLRTGEVLFEIAPLEQMLVEALAPEEDIALVAPGMPVEMRLESQPGRLWKSIVRRVAPRSEMRAARNIFVCEAHVKDTTRQLRPGMKGQAKIFCGYRPLAWVMGRRAWNYLRLRIW